MAIEVQCYCFPTFKDLLASTPASLPDPFATPFLRECKGTCLFISTQIFFGYFLPDFSDNNRIIRFENQLVYRRTYPLFICGLQRYGNINSSPNFEAIFVHICLTSIFTFLVVFQRTPSCIPKRGAKIGMYQFPPNIFTVSSRVFPLKSLPFTLKSPPIAAFLHLLKYSGPAMTGPFLMFKP